MFKNLLFGNFKQTYFVLETIFYITNKVELTLIAHEESSEVETFTFYFLLTNFHKIVSMNLVAKKQRTKGTPNILNHENNVANYWVYAHKPTP